MSKNSFILYSFLIVIIFFNIKLALYLEDEHKIKIEKCDQDIIFLE
jgi:hypothetical protein